MITELMMVKAHGATMTRAEVCAVMHVEPRTLSNWVAQGRFPKPMHSTSDGSVWATQCVAKYIDECAQAAA